MKHADTSTPLSIGPESLDSARDGELVEPRGQGPSRRTEILHQGRWLLVRFPERQEVLSWALVRGGRSSASAVAWYEVSRGQLRPPLDPQIFLQEKMREASLSDAVGLLTSRNLDAYLDLEKESGGFKVRAVATVGLSNALRVGDPVEKVPGTFTSGARHLFPVGTINLLCQISHPLSKEAFLEALSIAAEARSLAMLEAEIPSSRTGRPSTGTGTDCIVIAAPSGDKKEKYVGMHTPLGHVLGETVFEIIGRGAKDWKKEKDQTVGAGLKPAPTKTKTKTKTSGG